MPPESEISKPSVDETHRPPTFEDDRPQPAKSEKTEASKPADNKGSIFDVPELLKGVVPKKFSLGDASSWLPSVDSLLPKSEVPAVKPVAPAAKGDPLVAKAELAVKQADLHDSAYAKMLRATEAPKFEPGQHTTAAGAKYVANERGQITEFTPKSDNAGAGYRNISYDAKGELLSYDAPSGHRFTRTTQNDQNGFGNWVCSDSQGRRVPYAGSNAWEWRGKATVDDSGFHTMIGSGSLNGAMYSRQADGSFSTSKYERGDQFGPVLQTKVQLGDGTEIVRNSRVKDGHLSTNPQILIRDAGKGDPVPVAFDKDGHASRLSPADKPAGLSTDRSAGQPAKPADQSKPAETKLPADAAQIADRVIKRLSDSPNPVSELSAALRNMDNLNQANLTRRADGKHAVQLNFDHATMSPAINANIRGFRPGPTRVGENVSFVLSHTQSGIKLEGMSGFDGSITGPRGRVRPSWTNGMHIGRDQNGTPFVDVDSTVQGPFRMRGSSNRFYENNFPAESPIRQLMHNPDMLHEMAGALRMFQRTDDLNQVTLRKSGSGQYDVVARGTESKHIGVNQKLDKFSVTVESIDLKPTLSATISNDGNGVALGKMDGMTVNVDTRLGKMAMTPKKVALVTGEKGEPVVHIEIELKGQLVPIDVPVSKLQEYRQKK